MAVSLSGRDLKVILQIDDSLDEVEDKEYQKYIETLDETWLRFKDGMRPTYFVLKKVLKYEMSGEVKNKQIKFNKGQVDMTPGTSMNEEVRVALVGIEHPECADPGELVFRKDKDGFASKELIALLDAYNQVLPLFNARKNAGVNLNAAKKKSTL